MKVKEITLKEAEVTTKPLPGAQQISIDGKPVGQANDPAVAQQITQAAKDGKLTLNDPTKPVAGSQGAGIQEEPGGPVAQVNTKTNPPKVMDSATGSPLSVTTSGEEITPQLIARSSPDWQERSIQANGKTYLALYSGTRGYRVGKQTYQAITGMEPTVPMRQSMAATSAQKTGIPAAPLRESVELTDIKKLSGL